MSQLDDFTSAQAAVLLIEPFVDLSSSSGARVSGDALTVVITKPDGTVYYSGVASGLSAGDSMAQNASTGVWTLTIALANFISGIWGVKVTSDAANTGSQFRVIRWGVGVAQAMADCLARLRADKVINRNYTPPRLQAVSKDDHTTILDEWDLKDGTGSAAALLPLASIHQWVHR